MRASLGSAVRCGQMRRGSTITSGEEDLTTLAAGTMPLPMQTLAAIAECRPTAMPGPTVIMLPVWTWSPIRLPNWDVVHR